MLKSERIEQGNIMSVNGSMRIMQLWLPWGLIITPFIWFCWIIFAWPFWYSIGWILFTPRGGRRAAVERQRHREMLDSQRDNLDK